MVWKCLICGFEYDETKGYIESGIKPGTKFENIPYDWVCPICGVDKTNFEQI